MEQIKIRFFKVRPLDVKASGFLAALKTIMATGTECHVSKANRYNVQIERLEDKDDQISGDLVRIQSSQFPTVVEEGKAARKRLELPNGQALGHHAAFVFDKKLDVVAFQIKKTAVSVSSFNEAVSSSSKAGLFAFLPVIKPAELKQLSKMEPKSLLIRVADPEDLEAIEQDEINTKESLQRLKELAGGTYIQVKVSLGRARGGLDRSKISNIISWLVEQSGLSKRNVRAIKLQGKESTGDAKALDFLKASLCSTKELSGDSLTVSKNYEERRDLVKAAIEEHRKTLEALTK